MTRILYTLTRILFALIVLVVVVGGAGAGVTLYYFGRDLPDYKKLTDYVPSIGSKVYAGDGSLLAEFASENRIFVPIGQIPAVVKQAFIAAEDRDFYSHKGINPEAVLRAAATDLMRLGRGQRPIGASTITQQVVRHFLLTNAVSVSRKVKEILLAYRVEGELSKDRILEIYLNEIYLGAGSYGVAAAAQTYFQKPLDQLSLAQAAFLAALPKAPNNYNPLHNAAGAKIRRDWVLAGMSEAGSITKAQAKAAIAEPLRVNLHSPEEQTRPVGYFAEEVRRELIAHFGEKELYEGGLTVHTSYVPDDQAMADKAFRNGLVAYDRRHGWRGPVSHAANAAAAQTALATTAEHPGIPTWRLAAVTGIDGTGADIVLKGGGKGRIPNTELTWARRTLSDQKLGPTPRTPADVLAAGDIVYVEPVAAAPAPAAVNYRRQVIAPRSAEPLYGLRQIPDVSGGFVVLDPKNGRVLAMVGGWDFGQSQFNRATQAWRQPGSSIKPFVYITAMENGYTPDSVVDDSPIEISQGPGLPPWRPVNYEGTFNGPSTLRDALIHSRNLVTARLATMIGMQPIAQTVESFDVMDRMPLYYSMALGAGETTLLRLTAAYGMIDNGGHWLLPSMIDTVQDRTGQIVYQKGAGPCDGCYVDAAPSDPKANRGFKTTGAPDPGLAKVHGAKFAPAVVLYQPTKPDPLITQAADYEIISMMQGVVQQGTGTAVAAVGKPLAGKTGTTNDFADAWFVGFSPNLVAGGFVGFDQPKTLGYDETGGHVSAPIFRDFMADALKNAPATPFPVPPDAEPVVASTRSQQPAYGSTQASYDSTQGSYGSTQPGYGPDQFGDDSDAADRATTPRSARRGKSQAQSQEGDSVADDLTASRGAGGNSADRNRSWKTQVDQGYRDPDGDRAGRQPTAYTDQEPPTYRDPNAYAVERRQPATYGDQPMPAYRDPNAAYNSSYTDRRQQAGYGEQPVPAYRGPNGYAAERRQPAEYRDEQAPAYRDPYGRIASRRSAGYDGVPDSQSPATAYGRVVPPPPDAPRASNGGPIFWMPGNQ